jgi:AcrR family transcriptional regulator
MGTKERRSREKERRKKDILDVARSLFWANGFDGSTIPGIAKALELAPGTIYLYYPSKEAIYLELLLEGYDFLIARLREAAKSTASPDVRAEMLLDAFLGFAKNTPEYFDIIFFVLQKEFGGLRKSGFDSSQLERLTQRENECKKIVSDVLCELPGLKNTAPAPIDIEASWSMLAGVVFFWRAESSNKFQTVVNRAKAIILNYGNR